MSSLKTVAFINLGCKVNAYETDAMCELLSAAGYLVVPEDQPADVVIVNTCTVTNMADRKSRQMLHRAKRQNPNAVVVAAGCYVETADGVISDADILIGNNRKKEIAEILRQYESANREPKAPASDLAGTETDASVKTEPPVFRSDLKEYETLEISRTAEHTRAFLKVQDGCNQFCSYCAIPLSRGRVRSRDQADVVAEVERLAANGYKEVVLTGIHLSSYGTEHGFGSGRKFAEAEQGPEQGNAQRTEADPLNPGDYRAEESALLQLVRAVHEVAGIERIRLGSLEPRIITPAFMEGLQRLPKVCPHFHLSLQSGCEKTLRAMNRRYSAKEYRVAVARIRAVWPLAAICTDVIVGFPGETEADFEESYRFVEQIGFYETHVFKYSRRHGTRADLMPDQVTDAVKTARSSRLLALNERKRREFAAQFAGKELEVLIEEHNSGHSAEYLHCQLPEDGEVILPGSIIRCRVVREDGTFMPEDSGAIPCKTL